MSMGGKVAVISFPIRLVAGKTEGGGDKSKSTLTEDEEFDKILEGISGDIEDEIAEALAESGVDSETLEALTDFIKTTDKQGLQTLSKFAKNPSGLVQNELLGVLGKAGIHGALALAVITAILTAPEVMRVIVKAMSVKGAAFNQDFHRFFDEEGQLGFDRNLQYRRSTGLDVVITNDTRNFLLIDPGFVNNSLVDVDTTRSLRNSTKENRYGYVSGM